MENEVLIKILEKIDNLSVELKKEITDLKNELHDEIKSVKSELQSEIKNVKSELQSEIKSIKSELQSEIKDFKTETNSKLVILEELKKDIQIVAEGHFDLNRKLDQNTNEISHMNERLSSIENMVKSNKALIEKNNRELSLIQEITAHNYLDLTLLKKAK